MNNFNSFNEFALTNEQAEQTNGGCYRRRRRRTCGTRTYTRTSYCGYTPEVIVCPEPIEIVDPTPEVITPEKPPVSLAPEIEELDTDDGCKNGACNDIGQP